MPPGFDGYPNPHPILKCVKCPEKTSFKSHCSHQLRYLKNNKWVCPDRHADTGLTWGMPNPEKQCQWCHVLVQNDTNEWGYKARQFLRQKGLRRF